MLKQKSSVFLTCFIAAVVPVFVTTSATTNLSSHQHVFPPRECEAGHVEVKVSISPEPEQLSHVHSKL